jgi:hypothetical protein
MTLIGSIDPYALKIPARRAERSFTRFHPEVATRRHSALAAWPRLVRQNGPIGDRLQHVYGGGLHKLEPKELANVPVPEIAALLPHAERPAKQADLLAELAL